LTLCKLLCIHYNFLKVSEFDAYDGFPFLDIKPFFGKCVDDVQVLNWVDELNNQSSQENRRTQFEITHLKWG